MFTNDIRLSHDIEDHRLDLQEDAQPAHLDSFDDEDIELALRSVCWTPRDVHQFLRRHAAR